MIKDPIALLDKLYKNDLHLEILPYKGEYRSEVFAHAGRFDNCSATHFIMQGDRVIWIGELSWVESWVNAHFNVKKEALV